MDFPSLTPRALQINSELQAELCDMLDGYVTACANNRKKSKRQRTWITHNRDALFKGTASAKSFGFYVLLAPEQPPNTALPRALLHLIGTCALERWATVGNVRVELVHNRMHVRAVLTNGKRGFRAKSEADALMYSYRKQNRNFEPLDRLDDSVVDE